MCVGYAHLFLISNGAFRNPETLRTESGLAYLFTYGDR